mgnify:CR=1 FL=1
MDKLLILATGLGALIALLFAVFTAKKVLKFSEGTDKMKKISESIRKGANAFLKRQYKIENCKLLSAFDNSISIDDELLQEVLATDSNDKMKNIVNFEERDKKI